MHNINEQDKSRDIFYLMEKFKDDNKGVETRDICVLFSYW
jgi:hypothetical protein